MSSLNLNEPPHVIASEDHNDDLIEISRRAFLEVYIFFSFFLIFFALNLFQHTQQYYN
jgi:hypothetical protein